MDAVFAEKMGRRIVRLLNGIVNIIVLVILLLLVAFASYALWDSNQVFRAADSAQYAVYKPTMEDSVSFEELRAINPEVFAWLTVYGTNIDYPVNQGETNAKYVNTDAYGNYSLSGAIFLDSGNNRDFQDFNSILYGHHMEKNAMFGEIGSFATQSFFDQRHYGNLFYDGADHGLEFFAFFKTDAYDGATFHPGIQSEDAQQRYLQGILDRAMYTRDVGVTIDDRILLLSTCSSDATNERDILVAKITDQLYPDSFYTKSADNAGVETSVDQQGTLIQRIPMWARITLSTLFLVLLLAIIFHFIGRRKREE